jgi:uncharacterized membrane protein
VAPTRQEAQPVPTIERISANAAVYLLIGLALTATTLLAPASGLFDLPEPQVQGTTTTGRLERLVSERSETSARGLQRIQVFEVSFDGQRRTIEHTEGELDARQLDLKAGDKVLVTRTEGGQGEDVYFIADHARDFPVGLLAAIFCLLVVAIGRMSGGTALLGMAASFLVIVRFVIPGIISGHDPVTISLIGAVVILACTMFLAHGVNAKTATALAGTALSLIVCAALGAVFIDVAHLTGLAEESAATLRVLTAGSINAEGLLLGAMIIGALGVLDDVAVAQASSVFELNSANPQLGGRQLFGRAMNIGRDHIASTVNTLFLAYAGAALPLLLVLSLQTEPLTILLNREFIATEVVRTLVGSLGIVAAVPVTTAMAAMASKLGTYK